MGQGHAEAGKGTRTHRGIQAQCCHAPAWQGLGARPGLPTWATVTALGFGFLLISCAYFCYPRVPMISPEQVATIAHLARLAISEAEQAAFTEDLNRIFALVEQMQAADTHGVVPMAHPLDLAQRLRADEVTEVDRREAFQAIAPATEAGLYLVPRVIE